MDFRIYNPTVTSTVVVDPYDNPAGLTYVSNPSIAYWRGRYWAVMDGTTLGLVEGSLGQSIWLTTSTDCVTWTAPVRPFRTSDYCVNPIGYTDFDAEWQPNLVVVGDELWCTWSGVDGYISKLAEPDGLWTNYRFEFAGQQTSISTTVMGAATGGRELRPTIGGLSDWRPFAASNPVVLSNGVVACPFTLQSATQSTQTTATSTFTKALKHNALLKADGDSWSMTLIDTSSFGDFCAWEPFVVENPAGHVSVFNRNLDTRADDEDFLLVAHSYDGAQTFSPAVSTKMLVPTTRGCAARVSPNRWLMTHIDRPQFSDNTTTQDTVTNCRRNGALFVSRRGGDDFIAGVNFSDYDSAVNYPQFTVDSNGDVLVVYTSGINTSVRRSLRLVRISPGFDDRYAYILPRRTPAFVTTPSDPELRDGYFAFNGLNQIRSITEVSASLGVTYAAWFQRDSQGDIIIDCRDADNGGQVLRVSGLSVPGVNFLHGFTIGLQPVFMAAVIDNSDDSVTFYLGDGHDTFSTAVCYYKSLLFSGQPSDGDTVTVDGATYTFKTSASTSRDVEIGVDAATTIANLRAKLLTYSMQALAFPTRLIITRADSGAAPDPILGRTPLGVYSGAANVTVETGMPLDGGTASFGMKSATSALAPFAGRIYDARIYDSALTVANLTSMYNAQAAEFSYPAVNGASTAPGSPLLRLDPTAPDGEEFPSIAVPASCEVLDSVLRIHGECSAGVELPYAVTRLTITYKLGAAPVDTDKYVIATFGTVDNPVRLHVSADHQTSLYANDRFVQSVSTPTNWNSVTVDVYSNKIRIDAFEHLFAGKPRCYLGNAYPENLLAATKTVDFDAAEMDATRL